MNTKLYLPVISGTILVLSLVMFSCSSSKKTAVSCPEFSESRQYKVSTDHKKSYNKVSTGHYSVTKNKHHVSLSGKNQGGKKLGNNSSSHIWHVSVPGPERIYYFDKTEYSESLIASADNIIIPVVRNSLAAHHLKITDPAETKSNIVVPQSSPCDSIVLKSGAVLMGKVEEIGLSEIRYRRCDNLSGPIISLLKSEVTLIKYTNGTHEVLTYDNPIFVNNNNNVRTPVNFAPPKTEGLAIGGFIASIVGLFIGGIPLGTLAVVFGCLSLGKIKRNPARYKGRGLAIAAIIVGIIAVVGAIIVLSMM